MNAKERAAMDAGMKYGIDMLRQLPKGDRLALEMHINGVLIAFWGALWGGRSAPSTHAGSSRPN